MEKIAIQDYEVVFTSDFSVLNDYGRKIIITDSNVYKLALHQTLPLDDDSEIIVIKPGEESKSIEVVTMIIDELLALNITRHDTLIALGGGVVGDICGFVASIYKRGVNYIQIPTTLLAMVDSSIGGKTGVNYELMKNCIGTFYNPQAVIVNLEFLTTLDERQYRNGIFEIIKVGAIKDPTIIDDLETDYDLATVVKKAIAVKKYYVCEDANEKGIRKMLNFGHTLGHAIESFYQFDNVYHGEAVALGMLPMIDSEVDRLRIHRLYKKFGLKDLTYDFEKIWGYISNDKKRLDAHTIEIVRIKHLGDSYLKTVSIDDLYQRLKGV